MEKTQALQITYETSGLGRGEVNTTTKRPLNVTRYATATRVPVRLGSNRFMQMLKTLWAGVQEDPKFRRRLNGWLTIFWIAMIPVLDRDGLHYSLQQRLE